MTTRESHIIKDGELTSLRGVAYICKFADRLRPCRLQCDMWDWRRQGCTGYCFRWRNAAQVVFRRVGDELLLPDDAELVQTPDTIGGYVQAVRELQRAESKLRQGNGKNQVK